MKLQGNIPTLVTDVITAAFDVLGNAINRTEPAGSLNVYRSFLSNKLPSILESFSAIMYPPLTIENCITEALNRLDSSGDPFATQTYDLLSSSAEARQEFLFSCALFKLIPESSIESILGDVPMQSLPEAGKYMKADLVTQCTTNPNRIEELIGELENMEGNSGEIVIALVEVGCASNGMALLLLIIVHKIIQKLCLEKDSITLKSVCIALCRKPPTLDVILLFTEPSGILQPLCGLLDHWQNHEDQSK